MIELEVAIPVQQIWPRRDIAYGPSRSRRRINYETDQEPRHAPIGHLAHPERVDPALESQLSGLGTLMAILAIAAGALILVGR
jgi:hypothetical protein